MTNAAGQIWPHLQSDDDPPKQQPRAQSLADAMYRPQTKPPSKNPYSDAESLLRHLRTLNAKIDARLAREGKR